ncbi:alpha/beta hydrolase [Paenibacillus sp. sptzw28]|uniref:alpha/beta hydrolase n=1 Tax=Paenibacillus sp. sptzw28 TaxID=715179 RepID=UPI001C6F47C5|nr:alpha/beta hydrolase [Paenibacillus sp. sptzw28]QYR23222.1 alpha/beta hydrolase [Paenibacillus sp. sptzw28]
MNNLLKTALKDIQYGPHHLNFLDLWLTSTEEPSPLVVWFHGGGFWYGDKAEEMPDPQLFLDAGISLASVNYRLCPEAAFPEPMLDGARAIQFLKHHAQGWNINPGKIAAAGNSAGGHIALWLAFHNDLADPASLDPISWQSTRIAAVGGEDAQTILDPRALRKMFGRVRENFAIDFFGFTSGEIDSPRAYGIYEEASPINHASDNAPPAFLIYNGDMAQITQDMDWSLVIHHPLFGECLRQKLDSLGIECKTRYKGDSKGLTAAEYRDEMIQFFARHFGMQD